MTTTSFWSRLTQQRLRVVTLASFILSIILLINWLAPWWLLFLRLWLLGCCLLLVFTFFERTPQSLPPWLARWALQVIAVAITVPFAAAVIYTMTTLGSATPWTHDPAKINGFGMITGSTLLVAPWITMAALYRHISGLAERQALAFELERSEFARRETDAQLRLLQAQIEPHFLFNTLANVRELVDSGAPQASTLLNSLIAYLRAAVPRLHNAHGSIEQEIELVRAYLDIMQMRMPDRLHTVIQVDKEALSLPCPPMTILTLVENAIKHGIDPSEEGGRIEVRVQRRNERCYIDVIDTGIGMQTNTPESGTGLTALRARLRLLFGDDAVLQLTPLSPHGTVASIDYPAPTSTH